MELDPTGILEAISQVSSASTSGQEELNFLNQLLSVRVAGIVTNSLQDTARAIEDQIADLTSKIAKASTDLQAASSQSSHLSKQLNWLTAALLVAAFLTAAATTFQACETKRQTDLIETQNHQQASQVSPQAAPAR
jgi:hypothetical protein